MLPLCPVLLVPLAMVTDPPAELLLLPAFKSMLPPTFAVLAPPDISIDPEFPTVASPLLSVMLPLLPVEDWPVVISIAPESSPACAVCTFMLPLAP